MANASRIRAGAQGRAALAGLLGSPNLTEMTPGAPDYQFCTLWTLTQPVEAVWAALENPATWPRWWPGCVIVEPSVESAMSLPGRCYRFHWRGPLPYRLVIDVCITAADPAKRMAGLVNGVLTGTAEWNLRQRDSATEVRFEFAVSARQPWLRHLAPFTRAAFRWNYQRLMAQGEAGLQRWLSHDRHARAGNLQPGTG